MLLVASIAALLQLKHLRLSNQLTAYLHVMEKLWSPEMVAARVWLESQDFSDLSVLDAAYNDPRVRMVGSFFQGVGRLFNCGVLDEGLFGPPLLANFPLVWKSLKPIAVRHRALLKMPVYSDVEYVVYRYAKGLSTMSLKPYAADFARQLDIEDLSERCARAASDALSAKAPQTAV